jgi:hypothetical protein
MHSCQICRDRAFGLMHAAGAFKLGRSLRVYPHDVDRYLRGLAAAGVERPVSVVQPNKTGTEGPP